MGSAMPVMTSLRRCCWRRCSNSSDSIKHRLRKSVTFNRSELKALKQVLHAALVKMQAKDELVAQRSGDSHKMPAKRRGFCLRAM